MPAQSKEAILLEGNLKPPSRSYLDRVTHETRTHLRSRRWSLRLQKLQQKYPTKITLAPHLIILEFREWFHVDNGCFLQLFTTYFHKQCRFPPFNETLNGPRNQNTERENEALSVWSWRLMGHEFFFFFFALFFNTFLFYETHFKKGCLYVMQRYYIDP